MYSPCSKLVVDEKYKKKVTLQVNLSVDRRVMLTRHRENGWQDVDWIELPQDRVQ
jgi:hypothetical protein